MKNSSKNQNKPLQNKNEKTHQIKENKIEKKDKIIPQQKRPISGSYNTNNNNNTKQINKLKTNIQNQNIIQKKRNDKPQSIQSKIDSKKINNIPKVEPKNLTYQKIAPKIDDITEIFNPKNIKINLDEKIISSFMPYFEKNMTYTKRLAKNEEKVIVLYDKKINELINIYNFTEKYLFFISQSFGKICHPFHQILSVTYANDIKPYFGYFKNLVHIFETFSDNLKTLGHSIKHSTDEENNNISELMNVEFDLNKSVEKLNLIYADIFSIITNNLKENVLNKPLYNKVETVEPKFTENLNKMQKLVNKIAHRRDKLINKFKKEYEPMFYYYKDKETKRAQDLFNNLVCMKDFLFIEYDLISYCNKAFIKVRNFLKDIELLFNDSTNLFCDYLEALKTMIKIYYDENRFIINPNILSKNMISNLDKLIEQDIRKKIEKKLSIKNIIEFSKDNNLRNEMNHLLLNYRDILIQSQILQDKNKIIEEITNFNLLNFKSTQYFFSFLIDLVPPIKKFNFEDYIQLKLNLKRDAGLIKKWRNSILVVTQQGHILILDESIQTNPKEVKEAKETNNNSQTKEDNKEENKIIDNNDNNEIIVKNELNKGIVSNKLMYMYLKTSYGITVTGKKDDKFLFQLWAYYNGNKKSKELYLDALTQENLTQVINILNDNNDVNITTIDKQ